MPSRVIFSTLLVIFISSFPALALGKTCQETFPKIKRSVKDQIHSLRQKGFKVEVTEQSISISHPKNVDLEAVAKLFGRGGLSLGIFLRDGNHNYKVDGLTGQQFVDLTMQHLGRKVRYIKAEWEFGTNLIQLNQLHKQFPNRPIEELALKTWTGKLAQKYGFTRVEMEKEDYYNGEYDAAGVYFYRQ